MTTKLKKNVETFNKDVLQHQGYLYSTSDRFSTRVATQRLTDAIGACLNPGIQSILDVGCGDGFYTAKIHEMASGVRLTGIDPAGEAVKLAQTRYPTIRFVIGNVLDPKDLPQEEFDLAVLRGVLHHTADPERIVLNLSKRAKRILILEPNGNNPVLKIIEKVSRYHREHEEKSFFPKTIKGWCERAGYHVESLEYAGFVPIFFPTAPARLIHTFQPFLEKVPLVKQFLSAVSVIKGVQR